MTGTCARWCAEDHQTDEPCESESYDVEAVSAPDGLSVAIRGDAAEPTIFVEEIHQAGCADSYVTAVEELTLAQAIELRDALSELLCAAGACDCND